MEVRTLDVISQLGSINEAAEDLFVTPATVKKHLSAVYRKLGVKGREEAVLLATRMSVLPLTREPAQQESARGTR